MYIAGWKRLETPKLVNKSFSFDKVVFVMFRVCCLLVEEILYVSLEIRTLYKTAYVASLECLIQGWSTCNPMIRFCFNIKTKFGDLLTKLTVFRRFQPAIYTVVHEESESEVQNVQILQENLKISISFFL